MQTLETYSKFVLPHLKKIIIKNKPALEGISKKLVSEVKKGRFLFVFGSGHSALFPMELYHRAGGANFVIPVSDSALLPFSGPKKLRQLERQEGAFRQFLDHCVPVKGEMLWLASQSGINGGIIDLAFYAKELGLYTVCFTNLEHSKNVQSRHSSGKKLYEICNIVVDIGGRIGDAVVPSKKGLFLGPVSSLSLIFLGHSILVNVCAELEKVSLHCVYTSVNTSDGELLNLALEKVAKKRDPYLNKS
ncbi:MAG: sugar isomerase domain-containing protein [Bdellovibrio sp.]|nr:sugar isomerase domain-containing protein [Bdellovibrio sp.]